MTTENKTPKVVKDGTFKWLCNDCRWEFVIPYQFTPSVWWRMKGCPKCNSDIRLVRTG